MNIRVRGLVLATALCLNQDRLLAEPSEFHVLMPPGSLYADGGMVSADGTTVLLTAWIAPESRPCLWTRSNGFTYLPRAPDLTLFNYEATGLSADGGTVIGFAEWSRDQPCCGQFGEFCRNNGYQAIRWQGGIAEPFGPSLEPWGECSSWGQAIAGDGIRLFGDFGGDCTHSAICLPGVFEWTSDAGFSRPAPLPIVRLVSGDGSTLSDFRLLWSEARGLVDAEMHINHINFDGSIAYGSYQNHPCRWTPTGGAQILELPVPKANTVYFASEDEGTLVLDGSRPQIVRGSFAGLLSDFISLHLGLDMGEWCVVSVQGMSADGNVIAGTLEGSGNAASFALLIGEEVNSPLCRSDFDRSGFVDTDDFTSFVSAFEEGSKRADVDKSCFVDTDDFTAFVLAFIDGC